LTKIQKHNKVLSGLEIMKTKLEYRIENHILILEPEGDFMAIPENGVRHIVETERLNQVTIEGKKIGKWNSDLLAFLFDILKIARRRGITTEVCNLPEGMERLLQLAFSVDRKPPENKATSAGFLERLGNWGMNVYAGLNKGVDFLADTTGAFFRMLGGRAVMRKVDFYFALEDCSYKALPIVSLISFMVGLILAFVGAVQLKTFGAQIYVASLVTIGMTRIMGAIMAGIIMAGRTGASYAATIGTMQVNEEVDALKTMGISPVDFLVLPRMSALIITMPLLAMWADFMGMIGGGFVGVAMLDIPLQKYWDLSLEAITLNNFLVGIFHGFVFGFVIAVCGCYYGVYCGRNADSVGVATTKAVVSAIVWMIVMTGIITVACEVLEI